MGSIKQVGINGGAVSTVAAGLNMPTYLDADAANVYWTDAGTKILRKVAANGVSITTLAIEPASIFGIVLTPTSVIWEVGSPNGAIKSLPK